MLPNSQARSGSPPVQSLSSPARAKYSHSLSLGRETIDPATGDVITNVPMSGYDPGEVRGSTYDPDNDRFLITDFKRNLSAVTPGGVWSFIGPLSAPSRGIAFNGGSLWAGDQRTPRLREINPTTGADISSITVTLDEIEDYNVTGILSLTTDPDSGLLYGILKSQDGARQAQADRRLVTIDTTEGVATDIGLLPNGFANIEFVLVELDCFGNNSMVGEGTICEDGVVIGNDAVIGSDVQFKHDVTAGNNLFVGNETIIETNTAPDCPIDPPAIGNNVTLGFKVKLGTCVEVGNGVVIGDNSDVKENVIIGLKVTLGMNVTVEPDLVIGKNVTVGDGVTVTTDLP